MSVRQSKHELEYTVLIGMRPSHILCPCMLRQQQKTLIKREHDTRKKIFRRARELVAANRIALMTSICSPSLALSLEAFVSS